MKRQDVDTFLDENAIRTVIVAGTDPMGGLRGKRLTVPYFKNAIDSGLTFAWFIMRTTTVDDVLPDMLGTGVPDVKGVPDLSTLQLAPWEPDTAIVLIDWVWPDGSPCPYCPRSELKRQVAAMRKQNIVERVALEFEFYLMPKPVVDIRRGDFSGLGPASQDIHCYSIYEGSFFEPVVARVRECFEDIIEGCTPEWGQGQFEINLAATDALSMADQVMLFKTAVKQIAAEAGLSATFMAKWHQEFLRQLRPHPSKLQRCQDRQVLVLRRQDQGQSDAVVPPLHRRPTRSALRDDVVHRALRQLLQTLSGRQLRRRNAMLEHR